MEAEKVGEEAEKEYYLRRRVQINPDLVHGEAVIVTGRPLRLEEVTRRWLESQGIKTQIFFTSGNRQRKRNGKVNLDYWKQMAKEKAKWLEALGVGIYFEDNGVMVDELRRLGFTVIKIASDADIAQKDWK